MIEGRRNHTADVCGRHMIVYGGVNILGEYLNDVWELDLKSRIWSRMYPKVPGRGVAFHTMCAVYSANRKANHI